MLPYDVPLARLKRARSPENRPLLSFFRRERLPESGTRQSAVPLIKELALVHGSRWKARGWDSNQRVGRQCAKSSVLAVGTALQP
jgi:hypothetical protein